MITTIIEQCFSDTVLLMYRYNLSLLKS